MPERKRLVLDANILIRACLGVRVRQLIAEYSDSVDFYVVAPTVEEASRYVTTLAAKRGLDLQICQQALMSLTAVIAQVELPMLEVARAEALKRIRDPDDWPVLALALQLECAVWTEDRDFFGTGVPTWSTATVERYLNS
jgi:predicted nucleic acid-binding protein